MRDKGKRFVVTMPSDMHEHFVVKSKQYDRKGSMIVRLLVKAFLQNEIRLVRRDESVPNLSELKDRCYIDELEYHAPPPHTHHSK